MPLLAGARLGPYEVVAPLGSGGMGEVYRARDTRLGRDVALKVLPAERLSDPRRRARFVQEARAASALNHPHIVTIHEIESAEGIDFIVMELVPGETLARLLRRGPLPTEDVLRLGIPLADALAAAHAAGIVHRDLKPGNVMVTPDGVVKVLDFGLAKVPRSDSSDSDETTATAAAGGPLSQPGAVAGTAGYLSPEQARGADVDARSDVFSFGVLLYEMVTGRRAFPGDSSGEAMAAVLKEQPPPPAEVTPGVPRDLERIILRCLRKDPARRFQHIGDVKVELLEVKEDSDSQASAPAGPAVLARRSRRRRLAWTALGIGLALAAAAALAWRVRRPEPPAPRLVRLGWTGHDATGTFSPDGTQVAFSSEGETGNTDIWLKIVGEAEARRLTTHPASDGFPAWSPDGRLIAFQRAAPTAGRIHVTSPLGGGERALADFPVSATQMSWSPDGAWLAAVRATVGGESSLHASGVHLLPASGGEPIAVTSPSPGSWEVAPAFSPDGRRLAYASCVGTPPPACDVYVVALDADGRPREASRRLTNEGAWILGLDWTRDGRAIVYAAGGLGRVPAEGGAPSERVELAGDGVSGVAVARGADRLVFTRLRWEPDVYRLTPGGSPAPLITSTSIDAFPQYSPDGSRIAFASDRAGGPLEIWLAGADGTNAVRLTRGSARGSSSPRWSPDGRSIAFDVQGADGRYDVWTIGVDGSGLRQLTRDPANDYLPSWSHEGRFVYFASNRTGRNEVWRVPTSGGAEERVTGDGGCVPLEALDGRTLYYLRSCANDALLARATAGGPERTLVPCVDGRTFAVGPGGIYHVHCAEERDAARRVLHLLDTVTGRDRTIGALESQWTGGLSVSPDGRSVIYSSGAISTDLMMIENFR